LTSSDDLWLTNIYNLQAQESDCMFRKHIEKDDFWKTYFLLGLSYFYTKDIVT